MESISGIHTTATSPRLARPRNVFVIAPTELHWRELGTVAGAGKSVHFHTLLEERVDDTDDYDMEALLQEARSVLDGFDAPVDAIITQWDFPMTMLVPLLCEERGLRAPSLDAVVQCAHKYWSRLAQREALPHLTPAFELVDPFADDARSIELPYPFWLKPVKGYSSKLGFLVENDEDLERALEQIREELPPLAEAFDELLRKAGVSERLRSISSRHCLAEELLSGVMIAHEGHVMDGEVHIHGTLDMVRNENCFTRYQWPSAAPQGVLKRAEEITRAFLEHIGYDDGCFNAEYFWDEDTDVLRMIEVNPRISQSHSEMCVLADGRSNHEVAVDVALGRAPRFSPGAGPHRVAAKLLIRSRKDGLVTRVPTREELDALQRELGGDAKIVVDAREGERLSELPDQDAYSYLVAYAYIGAESEAELIEKQNRLTERLPLEVEGVERPADYLAATEHR